MGADKMAAPTETEIQQQIRELSTGNVRLFRNNNGVAKMKDGSVVRYGLGNGTSDLIGWESVVITPDMVGQTFARFLAPEVKTEKEYDYIMKHYDELRDYNGTDKKKNHYKQQIKFCEQVTKQGGKAGFVESAERLKKLLTISSC
jgi:hypothetical protein